MCVVCALVWSGHADAQAQLRVAVIAGSQRQPQRARAVGELRALGFEVVEIPTQSTSKVDPQTAYNQYGVVAFLRLQTGSPGVEVWSMENDGTAMVLHQVLVPDSGSAGDKEATIIQAVEGLRANLVDVGLLSSPSVEVEPTSPSISDSPPLASESHSVQPSPAKPVPRPPFSMSVGGGVVDSTQVDATIHLAFSAHFRLNSVMALDGFLWPALSRSTVHSPHGQASLSPWLLGVGGWWAPWQWNTVVTPTIGVGCALAAIDAEGTPSSNAYVGARDPTFSVLPFASLSLSVQLVRPLHLSLDARVGRAFPETDIVFVDRSEATWGRVVTSGALSLEVDVP